MLYFAVLVVGVIVFSWLACVIEYNSDVAWVICGIILVISLVALPLNHMGFHSVIQEYNAFKQTVQDARENGTEIERAAIQQQIAQWNENIAATKYWNGTAFGIFIPDEAAQLEPLR